MISYIPINLQFCWGNIQSFGRSPTVASTVAWHSALTLANGVAPLLSSGGLSFFNLSGGGRVNLSYITIYLQFCRTNTLISDAGNHGTHRQLWTLFAHSSQRHTLIRSLAMPPLTGAIQIERVGCDIILTNQPVIWFGKNTAFSEVTHCGIHRCLALCTHSG